MVLRKITARTRQSLGEPGALSIPTSDAVKHYFTGCSSVTESEADLAETIFHEMKNRELWLECDCRPEGTRPALICAAEPMTLRRMPSPPNPPHAETCCFGNRQRDEASVLPERSVPDRDLTVHGGYTDEPTPRAIGQGGGDRMRLPFISQVMFRILEATCTNRVLHDENPYERPDALNIYRRVRDLRLCGDGDQAISVQKMLVTAGTEGISIGRIKALKEQIGGYDPLAWPRGVRPQGYLMGLANGHSYNEPAERYELDMVDWRNPVFIEARPRIFAELTPSRARQPYIGIVSLAKPTRDASKVFGLRCYLQPCLSPNSWFPVDSNNERTTLKALINVRSVLPPGARMDIRKPLFDEEVHSANGPERCRPDFVLKITNSQDKEIEIAVETMGSVEDDYIDQKSRTHQIMLKKYAHLEKHDLSRSDPIVSAASTRQFEGKIIKLINSLI